MKYSTNALLLRVQNIIIFNIHYILVLNKFNILNKLTINLTSFLLSFKKIKIVLQVLIRVIFFLNNNFHVTL